MHYRELFHQGIDFNEYINQGTNKDIQLVFNIFNQFKKHVSQATLKRLSLIKSDVNILISGEMWCPDCQVNMTAIQCISQIQPKIKLSIISKEIAEKYIMSPLGFNKVSIPFMLLMDSKFILDDLFIERPKFVAEVESFDDLREDYLAGKYLNDTICEILDKLGY